MPDPMGTRPGAPRPDIGQPARFSIQKCGYLYPPTGASRWARRLAKTLVFVVVAALLRLQGSVVTVPVLVAFYFFPPTYEIQNRQNVTALLPWRGTSNASSKTGGRLSTKVQGPGG